MPTRAAESGWYLAECLLPGLTAELAADLAARVSQELADQPAGSGFAGAILVPHDEALLCLLSGPVAEVTAAAERAGLPLARIIACAPVGWPACPAAGVPSQQPWPGGVPGPGA